MTSLDAQRQTRIAPSSPAPESQPTHTVLYIEDNASNVRLVERILNQRPLISLHIAKTGQEGVSAAARLKPDLILLDNRLPDATGVEILQYLAGSTITAQIPVIILTSDSERETATRLRAAGADEFLAKPFDIDDFISMVDRYIG
jgi:CheY-like chemotaxis protein